MIRTQLLSSLHRVFPEGAAAPELSALSALRNEPLSFQLAYTLESSDLPTLPFYARVTTALPVSLFSVGFVPVTQTLVPDLNLSGAPGLYPDMLLPRQVNPPIRECRFPWGAQLFEEGESIHLSADAGCWKSLWITVNEDAQTLDAGVYPVTLELFARADGSLLASRTLELRLADAELLPQTLYYTNWFHCDCLADFYHVEPFSEEFWPIFENFAHAAAKNGMNMILLPAFTPPLDTPVGGERRTAQLVGVRREGDAYRFDFSLMRRFVALARRAGIPNFEHSHLFTQWGAEHAPKVMAWADGEYRRIFGWETPAAGEEYGRFLRAYLDALRVFLREEGLERRILFHISDEPSEAHAEAYRAALANTGGRLEGYMTGDALSEYSFYENGLVRTPIVDTLALEPFLGRCDDLWCYYTGADLKDGLPNRIIQIDPARNRILGVQMYMHHIRGFLHWGYNFYYDTLSQGLRDPRYVPSNSCSSFFVYPGSSGEAIQSTRQRVFGEGLQDMRALQLLESRMGRGAAEALVRRHFGDITFHTVPASAEALLAFREELNSLLDGSR